MKTQILLIVLFLWAYLADAQNVTIPDANFKNALIDAGIDTDEDGEISYAEAEAITSLDVQDENISGMTGIEAFVNLESLDCAINKLTNLDISNNTALTGLSCWANKLTSLDISNNTALENLICGFSFSWGYGGNALTTLDVSNNINLKELWCDINQLTNLDVSNNINLTTLWCVDNQLTSLDVSNNTLLTDLVCEDNQLASLNVSNNTSLTSLWCEDNQLSSLDVSNNLNLISLGCGKNQLTSLDVSNNTNLKHLNIDSMPSLHYVCIWEIPFPPAIDVDKDGTGNVLFTTDCPITAINMFKENNTINIFPNPVKDELTIEFGENESNNTSITLYDITGKIVYSENLNGITPLKHTIDLSSFEEGLYLINISNEEYSYTEKVIKVE